MKLHERNKRGKKFATRRKKTRYTEEIKKNEKEKKKGEVNANF